MAYARAAVLAGLIAAGCATVDPVGVYSGYDALPKGESQQVRIYLKPDGAASVQVKYSNIPDDRFSEGKWQRVAEKRIVIDLTSERKERLIFLQSGNQLTAIAWDRSLWGEKGPGVLDRVR